MRHLQRDSGFRGGRRCAWIYPSHYLLAVRQEAETVEALITRKRIFDIHRRGTIIGLYRDRQCREKLGKRFFKLVIDADYDQHTYLEDAGYGKRSRSFFFKFWRLPWRMRRTLKKTSEIKLNETEFFSKVRERKCL